jgi:hypothetical protein
MSRGGQSFKQGDFTKALRGAEKAGFKVQRAEVRPDGSIILELNALQQETDASVNPWNSVK